MTTTPSTSSERLVVTAVIVSFVVGTISGAFAGTLAPAYLRSQAPASNSPILQQVAGSDDASTIAAVKQALPAVVAIDISKTVSQQQINPNDFFNNFFGDPFTAPAPTPTPTPPADKNAPAQKTKVGGGSGFLVSADGLIVTNKHVVSDKAADYTVVTQDGKQYPAKVVALDPVFDLAIIKIEGSNFPYLQLGNSDDLTIGQTVIAIGNALAEFQNTVTKGVISGVNRHLIAGGQLGSEVIEGAIQTDAAINPGNSGGPLIDLRGQVIGVDTAISESAQSLGFALPSNLVKRDLESVQRSGRIVRPWIGVRYTQIDEELAKQDHLAYTYGALIVRGNGKDVAVVAGSPADKAGLVENDIILELNGQKLDADHSLSSVLSKFAPGDVLHLKVAHDGKEKQVDLTLQERPADAT